MTHPLGAIDDTALDHARRLLRGFGAHLKDVRQERSLSLRDLAEIVNVPHQYLGQIESGTRIPTEHEAVVLREWLA